MMIQEVEFQAREAIDRAKRGLSCEGTSVELKAEWTFQNDYRKAARQLAGTSNAARGQPVIWVIGVDENNRTVVGAEAAEQSNWWAAICKHFDSVWPAMVHNAPFEIDGKTVVALHFDTSRPPYLIRTGDATFHREIPWREANSTRSAHRDEVLKLLLPQVNLPKFEVIDAQLFGGPAVNEDGPPRHLLGFRSVLYADVQTERPIHAPHHRRSVIATFANSNDGPCEFDKYDTDDPRYEESNVKFDRSQITFSGPGQFSLIGSGYFDVLKSRVPESIDIEIRMEFSEAPDLPVITHFAFCGRDKIPDSNTNFAHRHLLTKYKWIRKVES